LSSDTGVSAVTSLKSVGALWLSCVILLRLLTSLLQQGVLAAELTSPWSHHGNSQQAVLKA